MLDYIHPSMTEDPWAHLMKKREAEEGTESASPEKRLRPNEPEEGSARGTEEEDKLSQEDTEHTEPRESSKSPEGLKIYD